MSTRPEEDLVGKIVKSGGGSLVALGGDPDNRFRPERRGPINAPASDGQQRA
ncbi:hypothetical protein [Mycolicibacterium stellerae]|uniref:hypothetical protein n=1 Tax=Mycolicibacterium stellerae TaxID=2358193 RepID=UPI0013DDCD99|nr:hypothetical protein [Mycolicibacterium stellerae]